MSNLVVYSKKSLILTKMEGNGTKACACERNWKARCNLACGGDE